jgi:HSP20 family protein
MRFDPFREFEQLSQKAWGQNRWSVLPMDAYRHGDQFMVHFDLPGADPSSIELTVEKNVLTVKAERRWQRSEGDEILVSERPQGSFTRQLFLGETLDTDNIQANYENGVLSLSIPVAERAKPRKVEITSNGGGATSVEATSTAS